MRWVGIICVAMLLWLSSGIAWSADGEVLPMRGNSPDGKIMTNSFQPLLEESASGTALEARHALNAAGTMPPEKSLHRQTYLEWKNHCELPQVNVDGLTLDMVQRNGFSEVAPYVESPGADEKSFMEILANEFSDILPPHTVVE